jgi:hypothetical protein
MKNFWNSKAVNILMLIATVAGGALMSLQHDHAAFHTHLIANALVAVYALEKLFADKPTTVEDVIKDVLAKTPPAAMLLLALLLPISGCPKPIPGPNGPDAADGGPTAGGAFSACTSDAIKTTAQGLLGKIANALATGDYVGQLAQLGIDFGTAEVKCAVQLAVASFQRKAAADPLAGTQLSHGNAWLKMQGLQ